MNIMNQLETSVPSTSDLHTQRSSIPRDHHGDAGRSVARRVAGLGPAPGGTKAEGLGETGRQLPESNSKEMNGETT